MGTATRGHGRARGTLGCAYLARCTPGDVTQNAGANIARSKRRPKWNGHGGGRGVLGWAHLERRASGDLARNAGAHVARGNGAPTGHPYLRRRGALPPYLPWYNRQRAHGRRRLPPHTAKSALCCTMRRAATILRHSGRTSSNLNYCCCLQPTNRGLLIEVFKVFSKVAPGLATLGHFLKVNLESFIVATLRLLT